MRRPTAVALVVLVAACGREDPSRAPFEIRSVVAPRIAELESGIGPDPPIRTLDADAAAQVAGLLEGWPGSPVRMRRVFAEEVARIGDPALPALAARLEDASATEAQQLAAVELGGEIDTPRGADFLADQVESSPHAWIRAQAAWQLSRSSQDEVVPRLLLRLKYEIDGDTVIWIANALAHFRNWAGLDGLSVLAGTGATPEIRASAAERRSALAREAGVEDGPTLWRLWSSGDREGRLPRATPSPRHRLEVWRAIARLAEQDLRAVDDARFVLSRCGGWVVGPLTEALHEETAYTRIHVAQCLERMGRRAPGAGPALVAALADPRLAPAAAAALGSIGWQPAAGALVPALDAHVHPDLRSAAARALGVLGERSAIEPLRALLAREEPTDLRQTAAQSLLALDPGEEAVRVLLECWTSPAADAAAAEEALGRWLASRAEVGDEAARSALKRWRALDPLPDETPDPRRSARRRDERATIVRDLLR